MAAPEKRPTDTVANDLIIMGSIIHLLCFSLSRKRDMVNSLTSSACMLGLKKEYIEEMRHGKFICHIVVEQHEAGEGRH